MKKLIYVDEAMFTTASRLTHAYSSRGSNISVSESISNMKALAVLAGVSADTGLETYIIKPKSINS